MFIFNKYNTNNRHVCYVLEDFSADNQIAIVRKENPHLGVEKILVTGIIEFENPTKKPAACIDSDYYWLFEIDSSGMRLYITGYAAAVGGQLWGPYPTSEQIKEYNDNTPIEGDKIKCIHLIDGSMVFPAE